MANLGSVKPRFGMVGTGVWARMLHAQMATESPDVAFTSVFGRNERAASELARDFKVQAYSDFGTFLDSVDIVGFALMPDAQPPFALAAADAGKHVLLEKPIATDCVTANEIAQRLERTHSASVVFFTSLFVPPVRQWVDDATAAGGWLSARVESFARTLSDPTNPFYTTSWRRRSGVLWDLLPHSVALLCLVLGDVIEVAAMRGRGQLVQLTLGHEGGAVATVTATLDAPIVLPGSTMLFGATGAKALPLRPDWYGDAKNAYLSALASLSAAARGNTPAIRLDARFGAHVTAVLAAAERSIDSRQRIRPEGSG
jgi:predicted dehydrogenase